jgi:hypothetical protein
MSTSTKSGACVTSYSKEKIKRKRKENFKEPCCYFDLQEMVHGLKQKHSQTTQGAVSFH